MNRHRRMNHSAASKASLALAAIKREKTMAEFFRERSSGLAQGLWV